MVGALVTGPLGSSEMGVGCLGVAFPGVAAVELEAAARRPPPPPGPCCPSSRHARHQSKHPSAQLLCSWRKAQASQCPVLCSQGSCSKPCSFLPLCLLDSSFSPQFSLPEMSLPPTFPASFHSSLNTHVQRHLFHRGLISPLAREGYYFYPISQMGTVRHRDLDNLPKIHGALW